MKKILKSEKGLSLLEVTIAGAIAVAIAMGVAKISQNASKGVTKVRTDTELQDFKNFLKTNFTRGNNCRNTFSDPGLNFKNTTIATLQTDAVIVPPIVTPAPKYYEISNNATAIGNTLDIVTNTDALGVTSNSISLTAGLKIPGYPNWFIEEMRIYQIGNTTEDGDANTGICSMYFSVKRDAGLNSKRSFGAGDLNFWITLSCTLDPATELMNYCIENQAVLPGFWTLQDPADPTVGIRYDDDVYVGKHLIVESDRRIKKDLMPIDHASEKISELKGFYYFMTNENFKFKHYTDELQMGLIAQDVEKIFPEAVSMDHQGIKSVRYTMLIPVLIEAHKEQVKRIDELERKIDLLLKEK